MSSSSVRISSIAAFSYNWNKGIDSKSSYGTKFKNSIVAFLKGLFCKYKVVECEVNNSGILGGSHENSIFVKEYRKLVKIKCHVEHQKLLEIKENVFEEALKGMTKERIFAEDFKDLMFKDEFKDSVLYIVIGDLLLPNDEEGDSVENIFLPQNLIVVEKLIFLFKVDY